jgi:ribosome-associated heat shock protein Hsp15
LDRQRIDKWLWHARVVRTRTASAALADGGLVRINGTRIDAASRAVRVGDVVTISLDRAVRVIRVAGFSERRGSAPEAAHLYESLQEPAPAGQRPEQAGPDMPQPEGRPDKRDRREIMRLKRPENG